MYTQKHIVNRQRHIAILKNILYTTQNRIVHTKTYCMHKNICTHKIIFLIQTRMWGERGGSIGGYQSGRCKKKSRERFCGAKTLKILGRVGIEGMKMMGKKEGKEGTQREERGRNDDTAGRRTWKKCRKKSSGRMLDAKSLRIWGRVGNGGTQTTAKKYIRNLQVRRPQKIFLKARKHVSGCTKPRNGNIRSGIFPKKQESLKRSSFGLEGS